MKKSIILLVALSLASCKLLDKHNQHIDKKISVQDLHKDINYVEKNLFKLHPDADWYVKEQTLRTQFDSLRKSIQSPLTPNAFFLKISPILSEVRQGHMTMLPLTKTYSNEQKKKYKRSKHPLTDFEYLFRDNRLYIKENYKTEEEYKFLQIGTEILSINGISPKEVFEKYKSTYSSDGYNTTFIEPAFARRFNNYIIAEIGFVDSVQMQLKCTDSIFYQTIHRQFKEKKSKAERKAERRKNDSIALVKKDSIAEWKKLNDTLPKVELTKEEKKIKAKAEKEKRKIENKIYRWKGYNSKNKSFAKDLIYPSKNDSTIAVLKLTTFSEGNKKIYDTIFNEIHAKNVKNLIIDLRGNTGGRLSDIYHLSKYLAKDSYHFVEKPKVTKKTSYFYTTKGKSPVFKFFTFPFVNSFALVRYFKTSKDENKEWRTTIKESKITEPKSNAYHNRLYVITDGLTFSAGSIIASYLDGLDDVIFVGEETGGTYNGTVAGQMPTLKLPHSKLRWRIGLMSIKPENKTIEEGHGIKPDIYISSSVEDIIEYNDPQMDWILEHIEKNK